MMIRTLRAIFPAEEHLLGFEYFQHADARPFEPATRGLSPVKAWWSAQLALLAYTRKDEEVTDSLGRGGLQGKVDGAGTTQYLLAHDGNGNVWVAFRGTEIVAPADFGLEQAALAARWIESARDWGSDLNAVQSAWPGAPTGALVHNGFRQAYERVKDSLAAQLRALAPRSLWLSGHSLGGALATLAAADLGATPDLGPKLGGLYTFGSPRVGNQAFVSALAVPHWRMVNGHDAVPEVPPELPLEYRHHGQAVPTPVDSASGLFAAVGIVDAPATGVLAAVAALAPPVVDLVPPGFLHHAPLLYVAQCLKKLG